MDKQVSRSLFFGFVSAMMLAFPAIAAGADERPPAGIVPTTATLDQVLVGYDKMATVNKWTTLIEEGRATIYGLKGTYREIFSHDDYREAVNLGVISWQSGEQSGQSWFQNENGIVMLQHNTHQENEIATAALAHHAKNNNIGLALVGETSSAPAAYVVEVHPKGGRHEWQFYDKKTYQLVRTEEVYPTKRVVWTYEDFRKVDGITEPWHVHRTNGYSQNDADYVTSSLRYNVPVASADLDIPQSNADLVQFPAGAQTIKLPAKILGGRIIVQVTIGDRGYDFQLDSGAGSIMIDSDVARKLGLTMVGESVESAGGTYKQKEAIIPDLRIGDLHMKNVVVDAASFTEQENSDTKIVGLLGFDLIANATIKIDYEKGTLEAMPPYLFVPPADAYPLDALWDDGVPRVPVTVGDVQAHFIIDTGADNGLIFSQFARAHPDAIKDQGGGSQLREYYPFWGASGVGGDFDLKPTQVKSLSLSGINYQGFVMYEIINNPGFEGEDYDGLLGHDFLKYFTVYLDYKDSHIYLIPNSRAR